MILKSETHYSMPIVRYCG